MVDGDIVFRPTNSNFNKRWPFKVFLPPNIVSITISSNDGLLIVTTTVFCYVEMTKVNRYIVYIYI